MQKSELIELFELGFEPKTLSDKSDGAIISYMEKESDRYNITISLEHEGSLNGDWWYELVITTKRVGCTGLELKGKEPMRMVKNALAITEYL